MKIYQNYYLFQEYENMTKQPGCNPDVWVNLACTYFFLGMYTQAEEAALKGEVNNCSVNDTYLWLDIYRISGFTKAFDFINEIIWQMTIYFAKCDFGLLIRVGKTKPKMPKFYFDIILLLPSPMQSLALYY